MSHIHISISSSCLVYKIESKKSDGGWFGIFSLIALGTAAQKALPSTRGDLFFCTDLFTKEREKKWGAVLSSFTKQNRSVVVDIQFSLWR